MCARKKKKEQGCCPADPSGTARHGRAAARIGRYGTFVFAAVLKRGGNNTGFANSEKKNVDSQSGGAHLLDFVGSHAGYGRERGPARPSSLKISDFVLLSSCFFCAELCGPSKLLGSVPFSAEAVWGGGKDSTGARPGNKLGARPIAGRLPSTTAAGYRCRQACFAYLSSGKLCSRRPPPARAHALRALQVQKRRTTTTPSLGPAGPSGCLSLAPSSVRRLAQPAEPL